MLAPPRFRFQSCLRAGTGRSAIALALGAALYAGVSAPAAASDIDPDMASLRETIPQAGDSLPKPVAPSPPAAAGADGTPIAFEADKIDYDDQNERAIASGNVVLRRPDPQGGVDSVRADSVAWDRKTGQIVASGNVRTVDRDGNQIFTERVELTDKLETGGMGDLLIALREGGRLAAASGQRQENGDITLSKAAYSGCPVEDEEGCPRKPTWQINAEAVTYQRDGHWLRFRKARFKLFGLQLAPVPFLRLPTDARGISGLLMPDFRTSASNGAEMRLTWYQHIADNKDLSVTGALFTATDPMASFQYRQLTDTGAFQITGYGTESQVIPLSGTPSGKNQFRGYFFASGRFQLSPEWSVTGSARVVTDQTFLRRYYISWDDELRSTFDAAKQGDRSYLSISGWWAQTMRTGERQGQVPIALPVVDWRLRLPNQVLGGTVQLQANTLAISRTAGQDTQRAFSSAQWSLSRITPWGQVVSLTALARADIYHTDDTLETPTAAYRGTAGWQGRAMVIGALDIKWPLMGQFLGGTQVLTPRIQFVASPPIRNLAMPNEDARAIDLEDSNLFALNRFSGYDRVEDGTRVTYGFDWQWNRPGWQVLTTIGQSYRFSGSSDLFPEGTGLSTRLSDIVGRTEVRFRDLVKFTWRFRLDKDNLALRRNEIDATIGSRRTYFEVGYLSLARHITTVEDLPDTQELRFAGRAAFAKHWSMFGSAVINMTTLSQDPVNGTRSGFQPLRTRFGFGYQDDCLDLGLVWRRDYVTTGDAVKGNSFQLILTIRNPGFR